VGRRGRWYWESAAGSWRGVSFDTVRGYDTASVAAVNAGDLVAARSSRLEPSRLCAGLPTCRADGVCLVETPSYCVYRCPSCLGLPVAAGGEAANGAAGAAFAIDERASAVGAAVSFHGEPPWNERAFCSVRRIQNVRSVVKRESDQNQEPSTQDRVHSPRRARPTGGSAWLMQSDTTRRPAPTASSLGAAPPDPRLSREESGELWA
jgi:hypothetical protein